jgi:hypothetical protein
MKQKSSNFKDQLLQAFRAVAIAYFFLFLAYPPIVGANSTCEDFEHEVCESNEREMERGEYFSENTIEPSQDSSKVKNYFSFYVFSYISDITIDIPIPPPKSFS